MVSNDTVPTPPKRWQLKERKTLRTIRRLADAPDRVSATARAARDMIGLRLTIAGICAAIRNYIDAGSQVWQTITRRDEAHVGEPAYELYPTVEGTDLFIKVAIRETSQGTELLLIISAHRQTGGPRT